MYRSAVLFCDKDPETYIDVTSCCASARVPFACSRVCTEKRHGKEDPTNSFMELICIIPIEGKTNNLSRRTLIPGQKPKEGNDRSKHPRRKGVSLDTNSLLSAIGLVRCSQPGDSQLSWRSPTAPQHFKWNQLPQKVINRLAECPHRA